MPRDSVQQEAKAVNNRTVVRVRTATLPQRFYVAIVVVVNVVFRCTLLCDVCCFQIEEFEFASVVLNTKSVRARVSASESAAA